MLSPMVGCVHLPLYLSDTAEPLRRQLYQAPVSKHLLASTIVSGFGNCIWDGHPGVAVWNEHRVPNEGAREGPKELKEFAVP